MPPGMEQAWCFSNRFETPTAHIASPSRQEGLMRPDSIIDRPSVPPVAPFARHYDSLDCFDRDIWGEQIHHGLCFDGRESPHAHARTYGTPLLAASAKIRRKRPHLRHHGLLSPRRLSDGLPTVCLADMTIATKGNFAADPRWLDGISEWQLPFEDVRNIPCPWSSKARITDPPARFT